MSLPNRQYDRSRVEVQPGGCRLWRGKEQHIAAKCSLRTNKIWTTLGADSWRTSRRDDGKNGASRIEALHTIGCHGKTHFSLCTGAARPISRNCCITSLACSIGTSEASAIRCKATG